MKKKAKSDLIPTPLQNRFLRPFAEYAKTEATSGIILMVTAIVALLWANSPWASQYFAIWDNRLSISLGGAKLDKPLLLWINDGLMAIFFFLVGLEIKREILIGELASLRKASLPIVAALGGMIVPAAIYASLNAGNAGARGWGIPMATDIAFALGVLNLLGNRVPFSLKIFLAAVAIADDIGAVVVIAIFYSSDIQWVMLGGAALIVAALLLLNRMGVRNLVAYALPGILLWFLFLKSGIHPTIAGVILAMTIPARVHLVPSEFVQETHDAIEEFERAGAGPERSIMTEDQQAPVRALEKSCERVQMPLQRIEHLLQPWVSFLIMPLFAFANAGVSLAGGIADAVTDRIGMGVILGLLIGKPVGVCLASYLAVKSGIATLPTEATWKHMIGVGILAGIGFTMSLFISDLAFVKPELLIAAKITILGASVAAGIAGYVVLRQASPAAKSV